MNKDSEPKNELKSTLIKEFDQFELAFNKIIKNELDEATRLGMLYHESSNDELIDGLVDLSVRYAQHIHLLYDYIKSIQTAYLMEVDSNERLIQAIDQLLKYLKKI